MKLIDRIIYLAKYAGESVMNIYTDKKRHLIEYKEDNSPITLADRQSHQIITKGIKSIKTHASYPIISEEGEIYSYSTRNKWKTYWLIDPIDGTREFINGTGEFSINIALISNQRPVLGVVYMPVTADCYWATYGDGSFLESGETRQTKKLLLQPNNSNATRIAVSKRFKEHNKLNKLLKYVPEYDLIYYGSALKICLIANNKVDLYPRFGETYEWDTSAGQCILEEAGGKIIDLYGNKIIYNNKNSLINPEFIAMSNQNHIKNIVDNYVDNNNI